MKLTCPRCTCPQGEAYVSQVYLFSGESLLVQGQFDEGDGGELLTELLQDDESFQQGQVLQAEDTQVRTGEHR